MGGLEVKAGVSSGPVVYLQAESRIEELDAMPRYEITEIRSAKGGKKLVLLHSLRDKVSEVLSLVEPRSRGRKSS
ncbi:MAG: hypothetical protein KGJ69_15470 [Thermoplasmata archaeon]|nr:hypothetical protein [Thermoplasmata archaeon]